MLEIRRHGLTVARHKLDAPMSLEHSPARMAGSFFGNEPFVTERDAAKFLNLSARTLQRWRTEPPAGGGIRFYKLGPKRVVYRISDCASWAKSRAFGSTAEADQAT